MRLFLIDYENVNSAGLHGIGQIDKNDRVILFYSHEADTLSFEIMDEMLAANIMPERVCLERTGKNALDFQLVTFLGYLIAKNKADEYFIISRDAGYQAAILFCREYLGVRVQLKSSIRSALSKRAEAKAKVTLPLKPQILSALQPEPQPKKAKKAQVSVRKRATVIQLQPAGNAPVALPQEEPIPVDLETVISLIEPPVSTETATDILHCLLESHSKTEFHNALQQHFDNDNAKLYYHCMKPCFVTFLSE
ncbi:MAG: hypothetical protein IKS42_02145 [Oscillospiraceae bacterium]|nr:hypothetical protein [Oscillospiraceae bacterium]